MLCELEKKVIYYLNVNIILTKYIPLMMLFSFCFLTFCALDLLH